MDKFYLALLEAVNQRIRYILGSNEAVDIKNIRLKEVYEIIDTFTDINRANLKIDGEG